MQGAGGEVKIRKVAGKAMKNKKLERQLWLQKSSSSEEHDTTLLNLACRPDAVGSGTTRAQNSTSCSGPPDKL